MYIRTYTLLLSAISIQLMHVMSNHKGADASKDYVEEYDCIGGHVDEYDDGGDNYMAAEDARGPGGHCPHLSSIRSNAIAL